MPDVGIEINTLDNPRLAYTRRDYTDCFGFMTKRFLAVFGLLLVSSPAWMAAADSAFALGRGWRPGGTIDWIILVAGFAGIAVLGLLLLARPFRTLCRRRAAEFVLLGGMIVASLIAVELVLRNLPPPPPPLFHQAPANLSVTVSRKGETPKKIFTTNSEGIRGPEYAANAELRVLCVGGSTTQCHYMDDSTVWTHLLMLDLQTLLPGKSVWVGSTGIPGFATPQHLKYVQENPVFGRYTHAVFLIGVNDVLHWLSFKAPQNKGGQPAPPSPPYWQKLATYQRITALFTASPNSLMNAADAWPLAQARRERAEGKRLDAYASPQRALNVYREHINAMIERCREVGVQPVFVTQPVLWAKDLPPNVESQLWMGKTRVEGEFMGTAPLRELMDQFDATLVQACRERKVPVVDLTFMNGNFDYFFDDCHFTERGAEVVANAIAEGLANQTASTPSLP